MKQLEPKHASERFIQSVHISNGNMNIIRNLLSQTNQQTVDIQFVEILGEPKQRCLPVTRRIDNIPTLVDQKVIEGWILPMQRSIIKDQNSQNNTISKTHNQP